MDDYSISRSWKLLSSIDESRNRTKIIQASYFMAYHSICISSSDCQRNLEEARFLADNITTHIHSVLGTWYIIIWFIWYEHLTFEHPKWRFEKQRICRRYDRWNKCMAICNLLSILWAIYNNIQRSSHPGQFSLPRKKKIVRLCLQNLL